MTIVAEGAEIARHRRSHEAGDMVCDPRHYLGLIERKPAPLGASAPPWREPDHNARGVIPIRGQSAAVERDVHRLAGQRVTDRGEKGIFGHRERALLAMFVASKRILHDLNGLWRARANINRRRREFFRLKGRETYYGNTGAS